MRNRLLTSAVFVVLALLAANGLAQAATSYILPQLAFGGGWSTTVYLSNTGTLTGVAILSFYDDQGNALTAPLNGGAAANTSVSLASGAAAAFEFPNVGPLQQGWISLTLAEGITGYAVFRQSAPGAQDQEAVVPLVPAGNQSASFPFDNRSLVTTLAVVNPSGVAAAVNVVARDANAAMLGSTQLAVPPRGKRAVVIADLPGLASSSGQFGTIDLVTATPAALAALALRFRNLALTSIPIFHGSIGTTQPTAPIPAPTLQASVLSSMSVRLSWTSTVVNRTRFRIESRVANGAFSELAQPSANTTSLDLTWLSPGQGYVFRMRVETAAGLSGYSNEATVTMPTGSSISPPTGLKLVSANQVAATLSWASTAASATETRVEMRKSGTGSFVDIGPAGLSGTRVTGLEADQSYAFRVRTKSSQGYSDYSNELSVTTPPKITVWLIHGIGQDSSNMQSLHDTLQFTLTNGRFDVNTSFSFDECQESNCVPSCSISQGAQKLSSLIKASRVGQIALVGYSMGGLIARDLIVNNWGSALSGRDVAALVTLGTPNLGYPYDSLLDRAVACNPLAAEMSGDFRAEPGKVVLSPYLLTLTQKWAANGFPGTSSQWLAAAGQACSDPSRSFITPAGCSDSQPYNDRVVCSQSATYGVATPNGTTPNTWTDPERRYVHTRQGYWGNLFCDLGSDPIRDIPLHSPPAGGLLATRIAEVLNALP
ncbi:fibronectin type III domain-containing protein [uncultured Paludibaculum sp.]|uniref:fibronectin type III domain-containing protein n=1 Tax=uncultured Paludibaculum sp. TaxID=1765020 RepID=UPI002AAB5225|nr:fibronectin type III domain-containing protein [uncultured Paludibaculum sp.]